MKDIQEFSKMNDSPIVKLPVRNEFSSSIRIYSRQIIFNFSILIFVISDESYTACASSFFIPFILLLFCLRSKYAP
jgi:hypothetical protein